MWREGGGGGWLKHEIAYTQKNIQKILFDMFAFATFFVCISGRKKEKPRNLSHPLVLDGGDLAVGVPHHGDQEVH
jgi:hypothetical protein